MKKGIMWLIVLFFVFFNLNAQNNKKIRFAVHWLPQAQFAGYYIGVEKEIYKKYGLDVEIIHASPSITSQELLLDGKADFASMFLSTALLLKSNNAPIINVAQLSQKCGQVLVAESDNIKVPSDLNGKKIGIWRSGFDEILMSFVNKNKLNIELVLINSTINLFLFGGIDAMNTMWFNEYHSILNAGKNKEELTTFFFADYGLDIPEDGIYMLQENYHKPTVEKFVKATLEAWSYTFKHKEEAIALVEQQMKAHYIAFNKPHQSWMLNRINELFEVKDKKYINGQLLQTDFDNTYKVLSDLNRIKNKFNYSDFYFGIR
ncbi:MAG: ABC transporter substrate-binding protein [Bacteroidetes bacterium]|nr:ABC transporter substrate-binding protein [Bacteroidota bacterium]MBU1115425.1 ABC transporter substrate-binding protein [Bacteroidota bacterium]MBU1797946.1 ABC transporter substrate-binding protein [Bacteroidota bacterium]